MRLNLKLDGDFTTQIGRPSSLGLTTLALSTRSRRTQTFFARSLVAKSHDRGGLRAWKALDELTALGWVVSFVLFFDSINPGDLRPTLPTNTPEGAPGVQLSMDKE